MTCGKKTVISVFLVGLMLTMAGCSAQANPSSPNKVLSPSQSNKPTDGTIASINQIHGYEAYTGVGVKLYQLFYWSNGYKVEAYLAEPSKPGHYPLLVSLHGGSAWRGTPHQPSGESAKEAAYLSNSSTVTLVPEYEGYMGSEGKVMGVATDLLDIQNALTAVKSLGEVKPHDTYLLGVSLGGVLGLMTASKYPEDVKAVVAVSPFVGLTDFMQWAGSNAKPGTNFYNQMTWIEESYGKNINSLAYQERSPDLQNIQAPVLLLQGTADAHVPWQTVQTLANQMKADKKTMKFVLYQGGQHGLHTAPYSSESNQEMNRWFGKYGLRTNF